MTSLTTVTWAQICTMSANLLALVKAGGSPSVDDYRALSDAAGLANRRFVNAPNSAGKMRLQSVFASEEDRMAYDCYMKNVGETNRLLADRG